MLSDPLNITVGAESTTVLPRMTLAPTVSTYRSADGKTIFTVKQNTTKSRLRHEIRITREKVAADPISAVNKAVSASVYIVIDEPTFGFVDVELIALLNALVSLESADNGAVISAVATGQL